jgi:hypothetical protein
MGTLLPCPGRAVSSARCSFVVRVVMCFTAPSLVSCALVLLPSCAPALCSLLRLCVACLCVACLCTMVCTRSGEAASLC